MKNSNFFQKWLTHIIVFIYLILVSCNKIRSIQTNKNLPYQFIENKYVDAQLVYSDTSTGTIIFNTDCKGFHRNSDSMEPTPISWSMQNMVFKIAFDEDDVFSFQVVENDTYIKKLKQVRSYTVGGQTHQYESILFFK